MLSSTVFGFKVADTYTELKEEGKEIIWEDLLKSEFNEMYSDIKRITKLEKQARSEIEKMAINEVKRALRMYYLDHQKYPMRIDELLKDYIEEDAEIIKNESFYYRSIGSGYTLGIILDNGEKYEIRKY